MAAVNYLKWIGCIVGLFGVVLSAWNMSFNVIVLPMKTTFNFTQSEVEMMSSMLFIGTALCPLELVITRYFGYGVSYNLGGIIAPLSVGLNYFAVRYRTYFHRHPFLLGCIQTLSGFGTGLMYMLIIGIALANWSTKHTGKILGIYTATGAFGKIFYTILMNSLSNDLGNFFAVVGPTYVLVFGACLLLHRKRPESVTTDVQVEQSQQTILDFKMQTNIDIDPLSVFKTKAFHLTFWPTIIFYGTNLSFLTNVTSFGYSAGMHNPFRLIYVIAVSIAVPRFFIGCVFDSFRSTVVAFAILFFGSLCSITAAILGMVWFSETILYVMTCLAGIGLSVAFMLPITMLVNVFGKRNHTLIQSLITFIGPMLVILIQSCIGLLYDNEAVKDVHNDLFCYGSHCFFYTFLLLLMFSCSGVFLQAVNAISFRLQ